MKTLFMMAITIASFSSFAQSTTETSYLVKFKSERGLQNVMNKATMSAASKAGQRIEVVTDQLLKVTGQSAENSPIMKSSDIEYIQPDYKLTLIEDYEVKNQDVRAQMLDYLKANPQLLTKAAANPKGDNPSIPIAPAAQNVKDPLLNKQWGMLDLGAMQAWSQTKNNQTIVVGVIDSGVDYTHPDLLPNMWRNPGESGLDAAGRDKSKNGIDDDKNGYVDDVVGYDFASNDALPYDKSVPMWQLAFGGGNPGHGTHCAGNIAAKGNNGIGISGVAPNAKIMALRFISEKGSGETSAAIKAIRYGVDNGAKILNNSWGGIGEKPSEATNNRALREAIQYAESKGVLFVVAAGNGIAGKGYDNDSSKTPAYPASYPYSNIVSVAAIDSQNQLGKFSNWGLTTVHIAAPGVRIFSTVVGGKYSDQPIPYLAVWEGTSMAAPHVAGAAALYWAQYPNKTMAEVKEALIKSAVPVSTLKNKMVSGGKLNLVNLLKYN